MEKARTKFYEQGTKLLSGLVIGNVRAVPSASACSSLGLCLNFISPNHKMALVLLYMPIFSSAVNPNIPKAFYNNIQNRFISM